jgi:hypothetical protein
MVDVDRHSDIGDARMKVKFCLDELEKGNFIGGVNFSTDIVEGLSLEELIGALVATENEWSVECKCEEPVAVMAVPVVPKPKPRKPRKPKPVRRAKVYGKVDVV